MLRQLQFGWVIAPGATFPIYSCDLPRHAFPEALHRQVATLPDAFESAWMVDHLQFDSGDILEGWTTMTYLMGGHPRLHFGNMVLSQAYRNPALLAKMAASLQYLSGNRLVLGIGTGWKEDEYHAYGYPFPPPGIRVEQLEEALHIIRALWTDTPATFTGQHYRISNAWCEPKAEYPPPIMIGGKKSRMLRLIARSADWWNLDCLDGTSADECRPLVEQLEHACVEVGRDPATLRRTWFGWVACAPTAEEARAIAGGAAGIIGTPAEVVEQFRGYIELGFDYFMVAVPRFPEPTTLHLLATEVIPVLRQDYASNDAASLGAPKSWRNWRE